MKRLIIISIVTIIVSCDSGKMSSIKDDDNSSTSLFMEFWATFDKHYAFFDLRNIDWEAEKTIGLQKVSTITNDSLLFNEFCRILKRFGDSHINLESDVLKLSCNGGEMPDFYEEFPTNESFESFLNARNNSLKKIGIHQVMESESGQFQFGRDIKGAWGYLRIKRFYGQSLESTRAELNQILLKLKNVEKIICDIRVNPGGNDETALLCASYFFKQKGIAFIKKVRNGDGHEDFSQPDTTYITPNTDNQCKNEEIFLLTNGASGSSADVFALVMSYLPNITIIGTNTEGIFSDMYRDTLSNGWRITLSNEKYFSKDMKCYEKIGIPVDIEVENRKKDVEKGIDLVIETIINELPAANKQ